MPATESFLCLITLHRDLDELFLKHQEALLARDVELAGHRLAAFEAQLLAHMRAEEEILLPVYRRAGHVLHGPVALFTGEHQRMLEFLARFFVALQEMRAHPHELDRRILKLFDQQATFKGLVDHHDAREEMYLYPTLDRVTTPHERRDLIERCARGPGTPGRGREDSSS
ncbi:MAG: hemerythrin domain-containing protein [Planctomycetota bacterium]